MHEVLPFEKAQGDAARVWAARVSTTSHIKGTIPRSHIDQYLLTATMASELSQLIESELRKAEGANKPDEHQRRLTSLRVKVCSHLCAFLCISVRQGVARSCYCTSAGCILSEISAGFACVLPPSQTYCVDLLQTGLEQPPPTLFQRVCTTKRQVIAAGVVTSLLLILIIYAAASHRHHTTSPGRCSTGFALTCCVNFSISWGTNSLEPHSCVTDSTHKQHAEGSNKVAEVSNSNLQAPPASHTRARQESIAGTPEAFTDQPTDDLSTNPAAERSEHKQKLNPHSEVAPAQATAPAPSQDIAPSQKVYKSAPALGPIGEESPIQSMTAVPAPAPTDKR